MREEHYNPYSTTYGVSVGQFELRIRYKIEVAECNPGHIEDGVTVLFIPDMDLPHGYLFPQLQVNYKHWDQFNGYKMYGPDGDVTIPLNDDELDDIVRSWNLKARLEEMKGIIQQ